MGGREDAVIFINKMKKKYGTTRNYTQKPIIHYRESTQFLGDDPGQSIELVETYFQNKIKANASNW